MESAHANTEASVSGHCLDSSGKSIECKVREGIIFLIQNIMFEGRGTRI